MLVLGPLGFTAPWILLGLLALPVLWFILRAVPPAPIRRRFPGVALLLGLEDDESQTDRTPWWLLLIRMLAVAGLILGFAGPVLNPQAERSGEGPLLVLMDATWADARDWPRRLERVDALLDEAARNGQPVAVVQLTDLPGGTLQFQAPEAWKNRLQSLAPNPWAADVETVTQWADGLAEEQNFETFWLSDGLERDYRAPLLGALEGKGLVTVFESPRPVLGLKPARFEDGQIKLTAIRARPGAAISYAVVGYGLDPAGTERALTRVETEFAVSETETEIALVLPAELRNRITRFQIEAHRSAAAVTLTDDGLRRREVALVAGRDDREGLELLSPLYYLNQALEPTADLVDGTIPDILLANPDALILADVPSVAEAEVEPLIEWIEDGGLLVRFAGPRLAASDVARGEEDPLMPVRLRVGGRTVGGAMSWGEPKALRPFTEDSPFFGLEIPADVNVSAQVLAQPGPELADRVIASLADGTPLVTRKRMGDGQVILFHVTANAEWSSLPLSGLFVQMLERLAVFSVAAGENVEDLEGTVWAPIRVLDAFGALGDAGTLPGIAGEDLAERKLGPDVRPGLYEGDDRRLALNVVGPETVFEPTAWPTRIAVEGLEVVRETILKGYLLAAALILLAVDAMASLALSGRLGGPRAASVGAVLAAALAFGQSNPAQADDTAALRAVSEVVLAYVVTGDTRIDETSEAGLRGLSQVLFARTSVEPAAPVAVNIEADELAFYQFLYWPITANQAVPSAEAYAKLNRYLRTGGVILFDTRDAHIGGFGAATPEGQRLQVIARPMDIPALEPIPQDHVLTRTFYLLQDFPGRYASRDVWVEAAPPDAEIVEGMPFRNLNDNVTPVVIGGNDWASAWARDRNGSPMYPVGRGYAGEQQREIAYRFGVNLIMHVLTGNYKSDQVHVPALLDRLGQ